MATPNKELPLIVMRINPDKGRYVTAIAIVDRPAIGSNFIAFSNEAPDRKTAMLCYQDDEKMELIGAAMIPGLPMYRNTPGIGEYMSVFEADTIREIAQVFAQKGLANDMNVQHANEDADSYVFQSYITDPERGLNAPTGIDVPPGTWIVGVKVNNPELWQEIKTGQKNGFSVEGLFDLFDTDITLDMFSEDYLTLAQQFDDAVAAIPTGCLMFVPCVDNLRWQAKARELVPGAQYIEDMPHVTILAGIPDDPAIIEPLREFLSEAFNALPLNIELSKISKFTNGDTDVVKIGVYDCNGGLEMINTILADMLGALVNYEFTPHITIAKTAADPSLLFSGDTVYPYMFGFDYMSKGEIVYSNSNRDITPLITIK